VSGATTPVCSLDRTGTRRVVPAHRLEDGSRAGRCR
jgi:hypothetical protein